MSGAGGKWMVSFVTEEDITKLQEAGYLAADITHRLPDEGRLSLLRNPMRGLYFSPTSSVDWDFLSTHLSVGSCFTMG